jgi:hypothetical protein
MHSPWTKAESLLAIARQPNCLSECHQVLQCISRCSVHLFLYSSSGGPAAAIDRGIHRSQSPFPLDSEQSGCRYLSPSEVGCSQYLHKQACCCKHNVEHYLSFQLAACGIATDDRNGTRQPSFMCVMHSCAKRTQLCYVERFVSALGAPASRLQHTHKSAHGTCACPPQRLCLQCSVTQFCCCK